MRLWSAEIDRAGRCVADEAAARPRVLHVTETFATGVSRSLLAAVAATPRLEHHLLYSGWEEPGTEHPFSQARRLPGGLVARVRAVRAAVREIRPDVVHLHSSWAGVYGRALPLGARVVYQPHCYVFEDPTRSAVSRGVFWLIERLLGARTQAVGVVSQRERALAERLAPGAEVYLVANQSDLERTDLGRREGADSGVVLMSGELRPQKDPDFFAAVAESCRLHGIDATFVWVGDGDRDARLRLESAGVRVTGWLAADGVRGELDRAALYLHTARYEGFPLSVLDAAARSVPLLVRSAPAFDGLGLTTFDDVEQAVGLLGDFMSGAHQNARANVTRVRQSFDPDSVPGALAMLYGQPMATHDRQGS